jgi:hypothetical protein
MSGLPDGSSYLSLFGYILEGLGMENVGTYIVWTFGIFFCHLMNFMGIWYILRSFGVFFPVLVRCTKKNLATMDNVRNEKWCRN